MRNGTSLMLNPANTGGDIANLLCHFNGTNGDTNFVDSTGIHTLTASGAAQITTANSKFGESSLLMNGGLDRTEVNNASDLMVGPNQEPFTIDYWARATAPNDFQTFFCTGGPNATWGSAAGGICMIALFQVSVNSIYIYFNNGSGAVSHSAYSFNFNDGNWHHMVASSDGLNFSFAVNGTWGGVIPNTIYCPSGSDMFSIGNLTYVNTPYTLQGNIDEFRVIRGVARWTLGVPFTPPTQEY